jgi:hypothetical protein
VQLQISPAIVIATYVIVLGSVGLGLALAFGLGGRAVASDLLRLAYEKTEENMPELRDEAELVKSRAGIEMQQAQEKVQEQKLPPEEETPARRTA